MKEIGILRLLLGLLLACSGWGLEVPEGFVAEEIFKVPNDTQGSWISLAADGKGKIYAGSERHGLFVFQEPAAGTTVSDAQALEVDVKFGGIQGLHVGFGSLYVMNNDKGETAGLYRLKQDGVNWAASHILPMKGNAGHGLHSIIPHPDGKRLTINAGNAGHLPDEVFASRVPTVWGEDQLLPRLPDTFGHSSTLWAPGGWVATVNPDGSDFELLAIGFRNQFDIAYNQAGDLFTFDADMEWDMGTPWYRPTRVCHVMSGAEFGWRNGSGKWPAYYEDSLPAIGDIGPSSPTGVLSGLNTAFPTKYRDTIFICDWTYGLVYALHTEPSGGSHTMTTEVFASGKPFPVVDLIVGADGAMYGVTGGRNTHSSVWRIRYVGESATAKPLKQADSTATALRRQLEAMHKPNNGMVAEVWPHLNHADRFIRFAARVVVEHNPVSQWRPKVLAEREPMRLAQGAIALARHGEKTDAPPLLSALVSTPLARQPEATQLALLRAVSLCLIRLDRDAMHPQLAAWVLPALGTVDSPVCREAARLLVRVGAPEATAKLVHLMQTAKSDLKIRDDLSSRDSRGHVGPTLMQMKKQPPPRAQMYYAMLLRHARSGWTPSRHTALAEWLVNAENQAGGRSYRGFLHRIRRDVLKGADDKTREIYATAEAKRATAELKIVLPKGPARTWTVSDVDKVMSKPLTGRNFENGRNMFAATLCAQCHQFQGEGGAVGPDLTTLGTRFSARDIAEAIIEPSKAIAEQYESTLFHLEGNETIIGRISSETKREYEVMINPFDLSRTMTVRKARVKKQEASPVSLMPPALINALNEDELKDLFAYLISGGNAQDKMFK